MSKNNTSAQNFPITIFQRGSRQAQSWSCRMTAQTHTGQERDWREKDTHLGPLPRPATEIRFRLVHSASAHHGPTSVVRVGPALARAGSGHTVGVVGLKFCPVLQAVICTLEISGQMTRENMEIPWYMSAMSPLRPSVSSAASLWRPGVLDCSGIRQLRSLQFCFTRSSRCDIHRSLLNLCNECHGLHVSNKMPPIVSGEEWVSLTEQAWGATRPRL